MWVREGLQGFWHDLHLQVAGIDMLLIDALADIGVSQQKSDVELRLLASQSTCHGSPKGASTKHDNLHMHAR